MKKKQILSVALTIAIVALPVLFAASCGKASDSDNGGYDEAQEPSTRDESAEEQENEPDSISDPATETARGYPALIKVTGSIFDEFSDTLDALPQDMELPDGFADLLGGFKAMLDDARFSVHFAPPLVVASGDSVAEAILTMSDRQVDVFGTTINGPDIVRYLMDNPELVGTTFTITGYLDYQPPDDTVYESLDLSMLPPGLIPGNLLPGGGELDALLGDLPDEYNPFLNIQESEKGPGSYGFTIIRMSAL